jgi:hypothetical protein
MRKVPTLVEGMYLLDKKPTHASGFVVIHNNFSEPMAQAEARSFKFLPYQLSMVV